MKEDMCFSLSLMGMASAETGSNEATIKGQILAYTEDWFTDNFSEHYDISDYEASVNNFQQSGAEIYAEIAACAVTTLKYNSVEAFKSTVWPRLSPSSTLPNKALSPQVNYRSP